MNRVQLFLASKINICLGQVPILVNPQAIAKHTKLVVLRDPVLKQIEIKEADQTKKAATAAADAKNAKKTKTGS